MAEVESEVGKPAPSQGSSLTGHSFVSAYQDCTRRWYLRYELGIIPRYTGKQLTFGLAWHKAIETYYGGSSEEVARATGLEVLKDAAAASKYQYIEDHEADRERFPVMFRSWVAMVGTEVLRTYNVVSLEETLEVELPNGFVYTGRLDEVLESKETGGLVIAEHKSTSFSLPEMERTVFIGDQVAGYMALFRTAKPVLAPRLTGCLLDVTFQRGSKVEARTSQLYYDEQDTARLLINVTGVLNELSQKITAVRAGVTDALLFPRNGGACSRFKCPYEAICRRFIDRDSDLPETLERTLNAKAFDTEEEIGG